MKNRDVAIDFVKVVATLLVMNSHMAICYGKYSVLATGGGIGDALFFFISGLTLFMGEKTDFVNWYKRRIGRIYPTVIAMGIVACVVFSCEYSFLDVMSMRLYWFLRCIFVCYLLIYPVIRYNLNLLMCIVASIIGMILLFPLFDFEGVLFYGVNNYFRWIVYFSIMLIAGLVVKNANTIKYKWWSLPLSLVCVVAWYGCNYVGRGNAFQLLSYIPLVGVCLSVYQMGKSPLILKAFRNKIIGNVLFVIGNLCLESYLIQKYIFTDALNGIFPLNIFLIMFIVLVASYILHVLSAFISQILGARTFDWKTLLLYIK